MLNLHAKPQVWVTHDESGCEFEIVPLDPRDNQKMLKKSRDKKGDLDHLSYNGLVVNAVVVDWKGVGGSGELLPPTEENKRALGEKFPLIASFLFGRATDISLFIEEEDAAKNA